MPAAIWLKKQFYNSTIRSQAAACFGPFWAPKGSTRPLDEASQLLTRQALVIRLGLWLSFGLLDQAQGDGWGLRNQRLLLLLPRWGREWVLVNGRRLWTGTRSLCGGRARGWARQRPFQMHLSLRLEALLFRLWCCGWGSYDGLILGLHSYHSKVLLPNKAP